MKKITLLLLFLFISVCGYSQLYNQTEGFETPTPLGPLPSTWDLGATGVWGVFEDNTPATIVSTENWGINAFANGLAHSGTKCASVNTEQIGANGTSQDFLATSVISIPAIGNTELHFWTRLTASGDQGTTFKVMIAPADFAPQLDPLSYSDLTTWTEADLITPASNYAVWTEKSVDLTGYAGFNVYIAFVRVYTQPTVSEDGDRWLIDDVGVYPKCDIPVTGATTGVTYNSATLTWTNPAGANSWVITATPVAGGTPVIANYTGLPPYTIGGLASNTQYTYTVRGICPTGFTSDPSVASAIFTTQVAPPVCGGNLVDSGGTAANYGNNENVSTTVTPNPGDVVTVTFTAFNTQAGFDFLKIYDGPNATFPLLANLSGTAIPPSFTSTAANGELTFVFTSDATTVSTGYAANITCAPAPPCRIPTAVGYSIPSVTTTSVSLNWTQPTNADSSVATVWDIVALPAGSPAPNAATVPTANDITAGAGPSYVLTGITPATCYDVYIRAVCATNSAWSTVAVNVCTLVAPPVCGGTFVDAGGSTANYNNNANETTVIAPVTPGDAVTLTFTAFNTQAGIDLLKIYDGPNATFPLLATLSGTTIPPAFTSSHPSGNLTCVFTSDATTRAAGWVANVTCAPPPSCATPTTLTAPSFTYNSATLSWVQPANPDNSTATSWEVLALPCGSPAPGAVVTGAISATTNTNFLLTPLASNTCFDIYVRAICGATTSAWTVVPVRVNTPVAPPLCGGNFVDEGGTTAVYNASSNVTTTICPTTPGDVVTVTFTAFNTEANFDALYVYNGNAVVPANIIPSNNPAGSVPGGLAGGYWGTTIPCPFTSSDASGCLTFVFRSDVSVQNAGWVANVTCAPPPPCRVPTGIASSLLTFNSVTLNWTQPVNPDSSTASAWQVLALPCGSPAPTAGATGFTDVTSLPPFNLTGLSAATCYDIYVRANCGTSTSAWPCTPITITTLAAPPVCGGNFVDEGGTGAPYNVSSNVTTTICPITPGDVVTVTFTSFNTEANFDALYVYNGNAVNPANLIASNNPAGNVPGGLAGGYWGTTIPCAFTSADANGCLTFVFRSDGSVQNAGWVSNITCAPPPPCRTPTAITATTVRHNSVLLNWTQPANPDSSVASAWQVLALPCGSPAPAADATGFVDVPSPTLPPFSLTGLTPSTCYDIYVRANCGTTTSAWPCLPTTITTLAAPPSCGEVFTDAGGTGGAYANNSNIPTYICPTNAGDVVTVTFTSFNTEATVDGLYVYDGNDIVPGNQIASANGPGTVPGGLPGAFWGNLTGGNRPGPFTSTTPDGCLTFVFRSNGFTTAAGWVANVTCAPAPPCSRPISISANFITQTSATLNWSQLPNPDGSIANAWEVLVLPAGSPIPTGAGIPVNQFPTYPANGLIAGTAYVFYVRAVCGPNQTSIWSAYNFATKPINDECTNASFAIVNQNLNCVQTTPGTLIGATGSSQATTCAASADDDVWFTFTATAPTHIISFNNVVPATTLNYGIYQGTDCGSLTQIGCNSGAGLVPGTTYYIRIYSASALPQLTNFSLCIGTLPCTEAPAFCTGQTVTYDNATNVPSLGQIGCLFTSPNPAFFFLQVNNAGPLSYLISQVDNAGLGIDVDYVAWGPFTDLNTACSGVPQNPLAGLLPALTPAQGCSGTLHACSYSANPTEIMCIPNAQLCDVYVIMITNFSNRAGRVTFTQTNTGEGTTACFPINTFNYPQTNYCQGQPNPTPVLSVGASAGTYTSTPGLVIDPVTGTIDLAASTPGPYIVTSTTLTSTGGACTNIPTITTTRTVIITAPASATIAYPLATYCNNIAEVQSVNRTGTVGGTYSSSPAGLLINANTGEIIPVASAPGLYTVTYTIAAAGGCPVFTTTTQVEILASPVITQTSFAACDSTFLPALTVGNYFSSPGGIDPIDTAVAITSPQNVYIYAVGTNGCIAERQITVTVNSVPTVDYTVIQPTCPNRTGTITVTAPVSSGSSAPPNLFISEVTDAATGSLTYVELYNATGAPVNLANYKLKFYTWGSPATTENLQCDLQLAGTIANNSTNVIKVSGNSNISGIVPNQTFTGCAGVNNNDNIRLTTSADVLVDLWGPTDGSIFTPSGQPGYTYRRINTATLPSATWNPSDWTTEDPEDYTNIGSYALTVSTYQYSLDSGTYTSNPVFAAVAPGTHTLIVKDITTGCLSQPIEIIINAVNDIPSVSTITYPTPVCQNATTNPLPDTSATGFTTGGTFTSNPATGIDLNPTTGEINLATTTSGIYAITYTITADPDTCRAFSSTTFSIDITNVIVPVVGFSYTTPICQNAQATLAPTLAIGFSTGGVFTSTAGLSIDAATGVIDLAASTAGPYTITYTLAGNTCRPDSTSTTDIVINPIITPLTTISYATPICQTATVNPLPDTSAAGFTTGGTFTSNPSAGIDINPSTGEINLASTSPDTYDITYTVAADPNTCQVAGSTTFTVVITNVIIPVVGFNYTTPICQDAQATLTPTLDSGFTPGGVFSSTTGLSINASTGEIDLAASTAGPYTVTYTVAATSCQGETVFTFNIVINPVITPVTTFTYPTPVCINATANPTPTLATGFTTGGTFTSNPSTGIVINATTGEIDLASSVAGTYIITYATTASPATCQLASSTDFTIVINPIVTPVVGFSYTTPICKNAQATMSPSLVAGFTSGGTFSSTTGLSINGSTGVIDLAASTAGSYTITYSVAANTSICQVANSATFNIVINPVVTPVTNFSYDTPFCPSETSNFELPNLGAGFTSGGAFSSTAGLIINSVTGAIDTSSTPGNYTVTYTVNADPTICQLAATGTAQLTIISPLTVQLSGGCQSVYVLNVSGSFNSETATFSWHNAAGVEVGTGQSLNVPAVGFYTVTVTVDGCQTISDPFEVTSIACEIQRGISVNNDGFNDTFDLTGFDVKQLTIFNRLGMKVYSRANYVNQWGGKSDDGDELPDGTYFYVIDQNSGGTKTGWIYINRAQ